MAAASCIDAAVAGYDGAEPSAVGKSGPGQAVAADITEALTAGRCFRLVDGKGRELVIGRLYDPSERAVRQCGARWRATLAEIAAGADILITMLPGSREVREVMAGSSVLAAMPSTAVWVDMTSSSPAAVRELAAAARARGVGVLDAPVGGGVPAARAGTLQVFVGGDAAVLDRCRLVLEALADPQRIIHVGGNGAKYTAKLLVNLL
jgi:3-hydroxyisobutyrate dehydrogenase